MVPQLDTLKVKIFADGADIKSMIDMTKNPYVKGFTTNPTLMKKAGVVDYEEFSRFVAQKFSTYPVSLAVFSDDLPTMAKQAEKIASYGKNIYVKIPISTSKGESTEELIRDLTLEGVNLNITAITLLDQVKIVSKAVKGKSSVIVSVFAGRIADTGVDPLPIMKESVDILKYNPNLELLWASPREIFNIFQANEVGCHIITVANSMLSKLNLIGKDLGEYSLETVKMFYDDACSAGYKL